MRLKYWTLLKAVEFSPSYEILLCPLRNILIMWIFDTNESMPFVILFADVFSYQSCFLIWPLADVLAIPDGKNDYTIVINMTKIRISVRTSLVFIKLLWVCKMLRHKAKNVEVKVILDQQSVMCYVYLINSSTKLCITLVVRR